MTKLLDDTIGPMPLHIVNLKVDRSKLKVKGLTVMHYGHLPGRTSKRKGAVNDFWAFTYISRGRGTYQAGGGDVNQLTAGSLFWEWPGEKFHFGPSPGEDWDEHYVCFEGSRVKEWQESGILSGDAVMQIGTGAIWIRKIEAIGAYLDSGLPDNADRAALLLESLVYDFAQAHASRKPARRHEQKQELVLQVLEDIAGSLYTPWNERHIWQRHHISRSTLRRIVHENTGYPLNEYVNRLKMAEATKLLTHTALQIKEIAQMLGFSDFTYFSRLFRKYMDMSAQAFRQSIS